MNRSSQQRQRGLIHNLILPSLVLVGLVLAGWSAIANKNQVGLNIGRSVDESREQLKKLSTALKWCQVVYPAGNNGQVYAPGAEKHVILPASPADGSWVSARTLVCPGLADRTLWAATGDFLPKPGLYLGDWQYRNDDTGVYLRISVDAAGNEYGRAVLRQMSLRLQDGQFALTDDGDTLQILYAP